MPADRIPVKCQYQFLFLLLVVFPLPLLHEQIFGFQHISNCEKYSSKGLSLTLHHFILKNNWEAWLINWHRNSYQICILKLVHAAYTLMRSSWSSKILFFCLWINENSKRCGVFRSEFLLCCTVNTHSALLYNERFLFWFFFLLFLISHSWNQIENRFNKEPKGI